VASVDLKEFNLDTRGSNDYMILIGSVLSFLDALSGSPIEIWTSFVVFDGVQKFAQIDPWLPEVQQNSYTDIPSKVTLTNFGQRSWFM